LDAYKTVRGVTQALCAPLASEDFVVQSMPDTSPTKWHLAHTSWFFEEFVLQEFVRGYRQHDPRYRYVFNSYYEAVGPRHARAQRGLLSRPTVAQTFEYRAHVDAAMQTLLERDAGAELRRRVTLGLHHEQQHQELLLTDIKHAFFSNPLLPAYAPARAAPSAEATALMFSGFAGGLVEIGHDGHGFSFDNELPRHQAYVQPFRLANRLITNAEFRQFIDDGGYERAEYWLSEAWATLQAEQWRRPLYWSESLEQEFTLAGMRALDPHVPVCHLSYYEADAFARWAGARLPSEFEWELAATAQPIEGNFLDDGRLHPLPVAGAARDLRQLFGDTWEWTRSSYAPYPGYAAAPGALGEYNGKFMVSQLVLRGGSCFTPCSHMRASYRNFFYPSARWQMSGVRLAQDG
jgi:ergothioneine biosynthesis protein EgtB